MKLKQNFNGARECVFARCSDPVEVILGAKTRFVDLDQDVGACGRHWLQLCVESDARDSKLFMGRDAKMSINGVAIVMENKAVIEVSAKVASRKKKRTPVPKRS